MLAAVVLTWLAAIYRIKITMRPGQRTLWRATFTAAVVLIAVTATVRAYPGLVDASAVNLSSLIVHLATILAGGCVAVYLLTLSYVTPPQRFVWGAFILAGVVAVVQVPLWLASPIHDQPWPDLADATQTPALLAYFGSYYAFLVAVLGVAAIMSARLSRRTVEPSARGGLAIIAASTGLGAVVLAGFAGRHMFLAYHPNNRLLEIVNTGGNILAIPALGGIGLGTLLFIVGPKIGGYLHARRAELALKSLHAALLEHHPAVALPGKALPARARAERMAIEIHDALHDLQVPPALHDDPYRVVAHAIQRGPLPTGTPASTLLPTAHNRAEDRRILLTLAARYEEECHASNAAT